MRTTTPLRTSRWGRQDERCAPAQIDSPGKPMNETAHRAKAEALATKRDDGAAPWCNLGTLVSIAHQAHLFRRTAEMRDASSQDTAQTTKLKERYLRRWSAGTAPVRTASHDPATKTYNLRCQGVASLEPSSGTNHLASFTQCNPLTPRHRGGCHPCFSRGDGIG